MANTFYRKGKDIFNSLNNAYIGATEWARNWAGKARQVDAPPPASVPATQKNYYEKNNRFFNAANDAYIDKPEWDKNWAGMAKKVNAPLQAHADSFANQNNSGDANRNIASQLGQSGESLNNSLSYLAGQNTVSQSERDKIYSDLGIKDLAEQAYAMPSQSTEAIYMQRYEEMGLQDLKDKIKALMANYEAKKTALNEATGKISENPWLDESSRVGRVKRLQELASGDIGNLEAQIGNMSNLYTSGLNELNNSIVRSSNDFSNNQALNKAKLDYLTGKAEEQINALKEEKAGQVYRYIPDYLTGKQTAETKAQNTAQDQELAANGYTYIKDKAGLAGLTEADIYRAPNGRIYRKPSVANVKVSGGGGKTGASYTKSISGISSITQSIIDNPSLFDTLTPTAKKPILEELQANGYDTSNLGTKGLSDTAIKAISDTRKALSDLYDLRNIIANNQNEIGPLVGLEALNPWSKKRKIQADIDRVKQTVGKALEGGVLRKEDEEKYKKILATITDTPETALYKLDSIQSSIQRDLETYKSLQTSSGRSADTKASLQKKGVNNKILTAEEAQYKFHY